MADRFIYLDHAATTAVHPAVFEKMAPYFRDHYGNPSSVYSIARATKQAIDQAREDVAAAFGASAKEIFFTGSGSEADNWAIKGAALAAAAGGRGRHIVTSAIEHHAVLETCEYLEKQGFSVTYLPVDEYGTVSLVDLQRAIRDDTALVSVMAANNEIGTVQPIKEIGRIAHERGAIFHTDAVQAAGTLELDVASQNIDMMSIAAHKFYGPKGVGALYVKAGTRVERFLHGGGQERGKRAGTENVAGIVGLAEALKLAVAGMGAESARLAALRDRTISAVLKAIPYSRLNGHPTQRLPNNANFAFRYIEGESLLLMLDMKGIGASSGSACTSGSLDPSHVLLAIGLPHEIAHGSLRVTFGAENTEDDVDRLLEALPPIVKRLRDMSPLYEDFVKSKEGGAG
ncbi:MAG: cysteine desulfurase NifS [Clostridiales bacterium]|nr:cysteine desulfurase NifS [Clostridiales bacterium]